MKKNEAANPISVGLFGSDTGMFARDHVPDLVEEFRIAARNGAGRLMAMDCGIFPGWQRKGKRIRPQNAAIKCRILRPTSR
jgi:hypothetical protein